MNAGYSYRICIKWEHFGFEVDFFLFPGGGVGAANDRHLSRVSLCLRLVAHNGHPSVQELILLATPAGEKREFKG